MPIEAPKRGSVAVSAFALLLPASTTAAADGFARTATYPVYLNLPSGQDPASETAAEIVAATADGMTLVYTDSPGERLGFVDIADPSSPTGAGTLDLDGEPTSVAVVGSHALVGVNTSESFTEPSGHVAVVALDGRRVSATCDVGGQPDSLAASPDGAFLAVAVENERDEDLNDGVIPQLPAGHLAILDLDGSGAPTNCDSARIVDLRGLAEIAPEDPEPEFVDINEAGTAAVTLQENNHVVLVDLASGEVTGHFSAGSSDLEAVDTAEDGVIAARGTLEDVKREPDAVAWLDDNRLVTADEGDYEGGSRTFTIFDRDGNVLFGSGSALDHLAMRAGHYPEHRSENKGVEPEGLEVATFGDETLIFITLERANAVAVYADGGESEPAYRQLLPTGIGPEGVLALPERDLLVVANEEDSEEDGFRSTIAIFARGADGPGYPMLVSADDPTTGAPIGWGALSGMVADPEDAATVYAVSDSAYAASTIYRIDVDATPATITEAILVTKDGEAQAYDLEGVAPAGGGGFWLASEGNPENENPLQQKSLLLRVGADGSLQEEIELPADLYENATSRGFEGVAAWGEGEDERVILALQSGWKDDPENSTKLAIYSPADCYWSFVRYPLEATKSERGGWVGLSEITWLGEQRFALIERDNQQGGYAALKNLMVIDLAGVEPAAYGSELPVVDKTKAGDILGAQAATNGWISDKPEGIAVTAHGRVLVVTDNDGIDDATGETLLLDLGSKSELLQKE